MQLKGHMAGARLDTRVRLIPFCKGMWMAHFAGGLVFAFFPFCKGLGGCGHASPFLKGKQGSGPLPQPSWRRCSPPPRLHQWCFSLAVVTGRTVRFMKFPSCRMSAPSSIMTEQPWCTAWAALPHRPVRARTQKALSKAPNHGQTASSDITSRSLFAP